MKDTEILAEVATKLDSLVDFYEELQNEGAESVDKLMLDTASEKAKLCLELLQFIWRMRIHQKKQNKNYLPTV